MKPEFDYDLIKAVCTRFLFKDLKEKHLEDLIQWVAMKHWENGCRSNLKWLCIDYCRINGIGKRAKLTAKTLECATLVGFEGSDDEDSGDNGFLLNLGSVKDFKDQEDSQDIEGILEEFLAPINLNEEVLKWAIKTYSKKIAG